MAHIDRMQYGAQRTLQDSRHHGALEKLTRIGFIAKGVVYLFIGILALMAAFGSGGETTDQKGVIGRIANQPFGEIALAVLAVGLLAYAAWRFMCAISDIENEGTDAKGLAKRTGYFCSGLIHGGIGIYAFRMLTDSGAAGGGNGAQTWSARLMNAPAGEWILAAIGAAVIVAGLQMVRYGWNEKFREHMGELAGHEWVVTAGKWGYVARGIVFGVLGFLVVLAAMRHDASRVSGLEGALDTLAAQPFGQWLLAFVAAGLACYGAFCFVQARYRRVNV